MLGHVSGRLLEAKLGIGGTNTELAGFGVPRDLGDGALDGVGVLEDHDGFRGDGLRHELRILTVEVLLEEIDLIVLLDAAGGASNELASGLTEAQSRLLSELSHVLVDLVGLLVVVLLGPSTNGMVHTGVLSWHSLGVNAVLRHVGDVVEGDLVRVTGRVLSVLGFTEGNSTDYSRLGVLEGSVSAEIGSLLLIGVFFSHGSSCSGFCFSATKIQIIFNLAG